MGALIDRPPLARRYYQRPTVEVARDLLGTLLVRRSPEGTVVVRLTEVEAYLGVDDTAAHTAGGRRTERVRSMWGEAGHAYVYLIYGLHHCLNLVTVGPDRPEAVLLRGGSVIDGHDLVRRRRGGREDVDGPGKLCQALAVDRRDDGIDVTVRDGGLWLVEDGTAVPDDEVRRGRRVGVGYAGEAAEWPLRWRWRTATSRR